jgi:hypothetical protein
MKMGPQPKLWAVQLAEIRERLANGKLSWPSPRAFTAR